MFTLLGKNGQARLGQIKTKHGIVETPCFMPVGTQAVIKSLDSEDLKNLSPEIILANTYHLYLKPGEKLVKKAGGLHKFMNWPGPILTDSGGFQVFSLGIQKKNRIAKRQPPAFKSSGNLSNQGQLCAVDEQGVDFRSYWDGGKHRFTPEKAMQIQFDLGADIIMAFDECTADTAPLNYTKQAMFRTHVWAKRSLQALKKLRNKKLKIKYPLILGIIQGGRFKNLRRQSAKFISSLDFDGIAIGGESIGYNMLRTRRIFSWISDLLPENKPRYAMGLGSSPLDVFVVVEQGVDMFDCVSPTRIARHGIFYLKSAGAKNQFRLSILNKKFKADFKPIDSKCGCLTCRNYSRAYLRHLFKAKELTALRLATIHNVHFMLELLREIREAIQKNRFKKLKSAWERPATIIPAFHKS